MQYYRIAERRDRKVTQTKRQIIKRLYRASRQCTKCAAYEIQVAGTVRYNESKV